MAFYELRQYEIRPGQMDAWLKLMHEEIIPFQAGKGMVITASFRHETDDGIYFWMRRFESEAEREKLYAAVYQDEHWKTVLSPRVGQCINRETIKVQRLLPTKMSPVQ